MLPFQQELRKSFFVLLSLPATAMGFGLSIQIAVLSWILSTKYGLDIHEVGIVWAAGPIAGIIGQPIVGAISDKVWFWGGRRRPFIFIGGILAALMIFCLPRIDLISHAVGFEGLIAVAITVALTLDLSINISFNPTRSIIADVTPEGKHRTRGYTWMQAISNFFGSVAYLISALIGNYELIWVGVFVLLAFSIIPMLFIEEPRELISSDDIAKQKSNNGFGKVIMTILPLWGFLLYSVYAIIVKLMDIDPGTSIFEYIALGVGVVALIATMLHKEIGKTPEWASYISFRKLLAAHSFTWLGVQTMFIYTLFFVNQQLSPSSDNEAGSMIGWAFFILNAAGAVFPIILLEPLTRKIGRVKTHILAATLMALAYFGVAFYSPSLLVFLTWFILLSIGWSSLVSLPFAIMSEKLDRSQMGFYMGIFNLSVVLPQLVASFVVGKFIEEASNKNLVFIIAGFSLAVSALLWNLVKEPKKIMLYD